MRSDSNEPCNLRSSASANCATPSVLLLPDRRSAEDEIAHSPKRPAISQVVPNDIGTSDIDYQKRVVGAVDIDC